MALIDILKVENNRITEKQPLNKIFLFREPNASFVRAYDLSAWLLVCILYKNDENHELKPTHRIYKEGDTVFVGWPQTSMEKFIPKELNPAVIDEKIFQAEIEEALLKDFATPDDILTAFQEWKNSIPVTENKKKGSNKEEAAAQILNKHCSLLSITQEILSYKTADHSQREIVAYFETIQEKLLSIIV